MKRFFTLFTLIAIAVTAQGQRSLKSSPAWLIQPSYSYLFSAGDMETRFGNFMGVGLGVGYKTTNNWIVGVDAQFTFGNNVKNVGPLLNTMLTDKGYILNETGNYGDIDVNQRGWLGTVNLSKTLDFLSVNPNSGVNLLFGAGGLWHYINFNTPGQDIPQVMDEYDKGYDEMTGGFMLKQSIGYVYMSRNRRVNFKISFEVMEGFTTNFRKYSYSTGKPVTGSMTDIIYGFNAQWILPIYNTPNTGGNHYYYD